MLYDQQMHTNDKALCSVEQSRSYGLPESGQRDQRFFRLLCALGGCVKWTVWRDAHPLPNRIEVGFAFPPEVPPFSVKHGSPDEFLEVLCAAHLALVPETEPMSFVVAVKWGEPLYTSARSEPRTCQKASLRSKNSARAALRRITRHYQPTYFSPTAARCDRLVCNINLHSKNARPSARDMFAARHYLREFYSNNGIGLWPTAPSRLRDSASDFRDWSASREPA
jgi:hypothetical protein